MAHALTKEQLAHIRHVSRQTQSPSLRRAIAEIDRTIRELYALQVKQTRSMT